MDIHKDIWWAIIQYITDDPITLISISRICHAANNIVNKVFRLFMHGQAELECEVRCEYLTYSHELTPYLMTIEPPKTYLEIRYTLNWGGLEMRALMSGDNINIGLMIGGWSIIYKDMKKISGSARSYHFTGNAMHLAFTRFILEVFPGIFTIDI